MTVASMFGQLVQGSLASTAGLERSREGYRPSGSSESGQRQLARLSLRMTRQPELATAREIAGLSAAELAKLPPLQTAFAVKSSSSGRCSRTRAASSAIAVSLWSSHGITTSAWRRLGSTYRSCIGRTVA